MTRATICALSFVLLLAPSGRSEESPPKAERFMDCISHSLKWFTDLNSYYQTHEVEPEARRQSIRYLTKLNNSLGDLEIDKLEFTDALQDADLPKDEPKLAKKAEMLRATVWDLQRKLRDYTEILPPDFRSSANSLENDLSNGLADKCHTLQEISLQLTGQPNIDRGQLVTLGKSTVKLIQQLRTKISDLIQVLAKTS
jgi:hypothetical protein